MAVLNSQYNNKEEGTVKLKHFGILVVALAALTALDAPPAYAQSSAAEMLEKARARSRDMEELKAVLNGPDQNMRLATFDVMVNSGDEAMRQVAIEAGLASADPLMQGMAFKVSILSLERIMMTLELDTSQPADVQEKSQAILNANGLSYDVPIIDTDPKTGTFTIYSKYKGQVNGTTMSFKYSYDGGQLELVDERTIKGPVRLYKSGQYGSFIATAKIR